MLLYLCVDPADYLCSVVFTSTTIGQRRQACAICWHHCRENDWIIELEITKENNNLSLPGADGELFSPEPLRGQHIFFSSLLQIFAFNRDNIWAAAVGLELFILEKHGFVKKRFNVSWIVTFPSLQEAAVPEGSQRLKHRSCLHKGNKMLSPFCCTPGTIGTC